jgi:2,3-bisphosphoglycerate-independent phosphoglycerate mutase
VKRILLVFLDGVGLGDADPVRNAFVSKPPPFLTRLLGGSPLLRQPEPRRNAAATLAGLDAGLGVPGTPQSGTGQTTLLTGRNGPELFGRHFGPWVPAALRPLLRSANVLTRSRTAGRSVAFANAYPEEVVARSESPEAPTREARARSRRAERFLRAGPPLAALGAGVLTRHTEALERGDAVASEITNGGWRGHLGRRNVPAISVDQAGRNLARIANAHDLTLYAHYTTDYAGHEQRLDRAEVALQRIDRFVEGLVGSLSGSTLLVIASDHGNIEDASAGHTLNPAIGLVIGEGHEELTAGWTSLLDVTPSILRALDIES